MKRFLLLFALLLCVSGLYAQDLDTVSAKSFYRDTLTATIDTIDVSMPSDMGFIYYTVTCYTTTGTDTVDVYTPAPVGGVWVKHAVYNLATDASATQIIVTTTPVEYVILDTNSSKFRFRTDDVSASVVFIVAGKRK